MRLIRADTVTISGSRGRFPRVVIDCSPMADVEFVRRLDRAFANRGISPVTEVVSDGLAVTMFDRCNTLRVLRKVGTLPAFVDILSDLPEH